MIEICLGPSFHQQTFIENKLKSNVAPMCELSHFIFTIICKKSFYFLNVTYEELELQR